MAHVSRGLERRKIPVLSSYQSSLCKCHLLLLWCMGTAGTAKRKESCAKKLLVFASSLFIQKSHPTSSGAMGISLEISPPCYGQYKGPDRYIICSSISFFQGHTVCVSVICRKKLFEHLRETWEKFWVGFSVVSWTLQQGSVLFLFFNIYWLGYDATKSVWFAGK